MRLRPLVTLVSCASLLAACGDGDEAGGFDAEVPEFADDADVEGGDIAQRPVDALSANLAVDGRSVDLLGAVCLITDVEVPGGFGFQAGLDEGEGSVSVAIDPESGDARLELFLDGQLVPTSDATASFEAGTWQVRVAGGPATETDAAGTEAGEGPSTGDGDGIAEVPEVLVSFECPTEFEERFLGEAGFPDVTPDPER